MKKKLCIFFCFLLIFCSICVPVYAGVPSSNFRRISTINDSVYNFAVENCNLNSVSYPTGWKVAYLLLYNTNTKKSAILYCDDGSIICSSYDDHVVLTAAAGSLAKLYLNDNYSSNLTYSAGCSGSIVSSCNVGTGCDYNLVLGGGTTSSNTSFFTELENFFINFRQAHLYQALKPTTLQGVLTEVISLIPLLIPLTVAYLSLRKGLQFTLNILKAS